MEPQYLHAIEVKKINHASMIIGHAGVMVPVNHILFGDP